VSAATPVLQVRDLHTSSTRWTAWFAPSTACRSISLPARRSESWASQAAGKSVTALSILRLIPPQTGRIASGSIRFEGRELTTLSEAEMKSLRGHRISMIFQEPMTSLNPVLTIGTQIAENVVRHLHVPRRAALERAREMLDLVRISDASRRLGEYPHQLSGGMRQRVMIAMALSCDPQVLIADEPTTALDVTIQAQILDLMLELKEKTGTAIVLITHDLGVVAETAERVVVMYAGRKAEEASVDALFALAAAPLYARPDAGDPARRCRGRRRRHAHAAAGDTGPGAGADAADRGLRLRPALRLCNRPLPRRAAALHRGAARPCRRLLGSRARARECSMSNAPVLEVQGLMKHFPIHGGLLQRQVGAVKAVDRRELRHRPRRDAGPGGRIRVRQIDHRQDRAEADRADGWQDSARRRGRDEAQAGAMWPHRRRIQTISRIPIRR